ncbi:Dps family protein [Chitinophaga ginsengisoli]|uniref:Starvation-inducible DNA-binding protein n=1 Tax=Chitinophaga ginsengisoli TaxID=363837 RepID=A0A2P8GAM9_9BACT|nr:DNA starvation/stationary phase protection protein [Chitinophaga ginsengisoli]PSL31031.1 starvation-inducible DNA-binding protein [Chitinophaga ginsengisoli]
MKTTIGIKQEFLAEVAHSLGKILADEFVLYTKTRKAHWCVTGPDFHSKHLFFESQYNQLEEIVDDVAERIRTLGHFPPATLKEFLALTHLTEQSREKNDSMGYIKELLGDHESILIHLRENINGYVTALHDAGTSDYITGLMETHEKMAWMLRAHLE